MGPKSQEPADQTVDISKINITADITKLLSSLGSLPAAAPKVAETAPPVAVVRDPRQARTVGINSPTRSPTSEVGAPMAPKTLFDPRLASQDLTTRDPRRQGAVATSKSEKLSIYEQGGLKMENDVEDAYKGEIFLLFLKIVKL